MPASKTDNKLRFQEKDDIYSDVEHKLKRKYGRGIFVDGDTQSGDGAIFIKLGNSSPQDVSDRRDHDRVLKFIEYNGIYTLEAEPTGNGFVIDLPNRNEVYDGFQEQKKQLLPFSPSNIWDNTGK